MSIEIKERLRAIWLVDKPERWVALEELESFLPDKAFRKAFADVWINSESNDRNLDIIDRLATKRNVTMENVIKTLDAYDRKWWVSLPAFFAVFRGCTFEDPYADWSWTTDRDKAMWFARRCHAATPALASGWVKKEDVIFASNDRGEHEVAVRPENVHRKEVERVGPYLKNPSYALYAAFQSGDVPNALNDPERLKTFIQLRAMHEPPEQFDQIKQQYYDAANELERAGLKTAPRLRKEALDAINWTALKTATTKARNALGEAISPARSPFPKRTGATE